MNKGKLFVCVTNPLPSEISVVNFIKKERLLGNRTPFFVQSKFIGRTRKYVVLTPFQENSHKWMLNDNYREYDYHEWVTCVTMKTLYKITDTCRIVKTC